MKKIILGLMIMTIVFTTGCSRPVVEKVEQDSRKRVSIINLEKKDFVKSIETSSKLEAKEIVTISAKASGTVNYTKGDLGSNVKKGELLAKIDDTTYRLQYENAKLALNRMKDFEDENLKPQDIERVESQFETAKINYNNIKTSYENTKKLYEEGAVSKTEFDNIESQFKVVEENYISAEKSLKQANRNHTYNIASAQNAEALARQTLNDTSIKSPISGIISMKNITKGETINMGTPVYQIVNIDQLYVTAGVSEKDIPYVKKGQKAKVTVSAIGDKVFEGVVEHISPIADERTNTYEIKVAVNNKNHEIKAGMFGSLEILVDTRENKLAIPKEIVMKKNEQKYVYAIEDNKAVKKEIKTGYESEDYLEVVEGITEEDEIVLLGYDLLKEGDEVLKK